MGRAVHLQSTARAQIVSLHETGDYSYRQIAQFMKCSYKAVYNAIHKYQQTGSYEDSAGRGRKRKGTAADVRVLKRLAQVNPKSTSSELNKMWRESGGPDVTDRTVQSRLKGSGFVNKVALRRPKLTRQQKRARLQFARTYQHWTYRQWKRVLWTDESKFVMLGSDSRKQRVWRMKGEELKENCVQSTVKWGGGNIMVWGCMSGSGVGGLARVRGTMDATQYVNILRTNMLPSAGTMFPHKLDWIFQQDNDPKHTSRLAKDFLSQEVPSVLP